MAFYDASLQLSTAQAITTTAASTNIYDVTGAGSGNAPNQIFGNSTEYGFDIGAGEGVATPVARFVVTAAGTGTGTITFQVQAAQDNGSNAPGTYRTLTSSAAYVGTDLDVGDVITLPIPPYALIEPGMGLPRFYRFNYVQTGDGAASVTAGILLNPPSGALITQYANNYSSPN